MSRQFIVRALSPLFLLGCTATAPVQGVSLPRERTNDCLTACQQLGLEMSAVVVIANSVGCVCEPQNKGNAPKSATAAAGGLVVIHAQQQSASQQQQHSTYYGH